jgi:hypothetical protein
MNPDLYGAWLTAGNNLQPVGAWLGRNWIWLGAAVMAAGIAWWALRRELRAAGDQVTAILAEPATQNTDWGTDDELLLDAYLTYYGNGGLQKLRDAIDQHRKEKP